MSKVITNSYGQRWVPHSCRFPEETYSYISKMSKRRRCSFNKMLMEYLSTRQKYWKDMIKLTFYLTMIPFPIFIVMILNNFHIFIR